MGQSAVPFLHGQVTRFELLARTLDARGWTNLYDKFQGTVKCDPKPHHGVRRAQHVAARIAPVRGKHAEPTPSGQRSAYVCP